MSLDRESYFFTPRYTRGEVCQALSVTKDTLRHYEKCGIINPQENKDNRYKYYSIADLEVLNVILFLRSLDIPIKEIPKFIQCKDINRYESFLDEQIDKVTNKINYWSQIKEMLSYLKKTLSDYNKDFKNLRLVENITLKFRMSEFDYSNYDIYKMVPSKVPNTAIYNVVKLKIVDDRWILSNREDVSGIKIGYFCGEEECDDDISSINIALALRVITLESLDKIPDIIIKTKKENNDKYEFGDNVYIIEHTFINIFNQEALLRNIYLEITKVKES